MVPAVMPLVWSVGEAVMSRFAAGFKKMVGPLTGIVVAARGA
jgi:hypothetical protein